jgi:hypothetical protein
MGDFCTNRKTIGSNVGNKVRFLIHPQIKYKL